MDVRIGVTYTPKEIDLALADDIDRDDLQADIEAALGGGAILWLTDKKGKKVGVPTDKLAYIEIGSPDDDRRIGFGS